MDQITETAVRGLTLRLATHNRSLALCARMNYETENLDFIDAIPAGSVFFDVGACEGRFALYAASRGLRCWAFEPESRNFAVLEANRRQNQALVGDRLTCRRVALGARRHAASLLVGQPWGGGHHKVVDSAAGRDTLAFAVQERQEIEVVALDDLIHSRELPAPDYLKVDVDGSEWDFVRGAAASLRAPSLRGLMIELDLADHRFQPIVAELVAAGLCERSRHLIPNERTLYNVWYERDQAGER